MIHDLLVSGVTVFPGREHFEFVPGINVVVGGNDSGKSHLLKLCYTVAKWSADGGRKSLPEKWAEEQRLRKDLMRVFASRGLAGLTARNRGNAHARVEASMEGDGVPEGMGNLVFDFQAGHEEEGLSIREMPRRFLNVPVVFLAAREVLTIYPSFVQVGSRFPEFLDGGSWDLCRYLDMEAEAEPISTDAGRVVARLEKIIGGKVVKRDGRFFLQRPGQQPIEMSLVAEGFKRLGTLSYLIRNGSVKKGSVLFWDEPEMNLNASHLPVLVGENPDGACQDGGAGYFVLPQPVPAAGADDSAFRTPQCHGAEKVFRDERAAGGTFRGKGVLGGIPGGRGAYRVS